MIIKITMIIMIVSSQHEFHFVIKIIIILISSFRIRIIILILIIKITTISSPHEFHFVHEGLPHARHKRSIPHSRKLKTDPQVRMWLVICSLELCIDHWLLVCIDPINKDRVQQCTKPKNDTSIAMQFYDSSNSERGKVPMMGGGVQMFQNFKPLQNWILWCESICKVAQFRRLFVGGRKDRISKASPLW